MLIDSLLVLGLIVANGALALSEIAIVSSRRTRLVRMTRSGSRGAARALALAAEPTRFLSTVQVGITSIGVLSGAIGEATLAAPVQQALQRVSAVAPYAESLALAVVVVTITYVSLIVGELVPKRLAMADPEKIAAVIAGPMQLLATLGRPIVHLLSASTDALLTLVRAPMVKRSALTVEEIKVLLEQSATEGVLEPGEREMMTNVLNLDERHVAGVLTPRSEVVFLDVRDSPDVNRGKLGREPHDILPLCEGGLEHVLGFVRIRAVLAQVLAGERVDLSALAEPALFVPETMTLMRLLEEFKRRNLAAALVVDEFGEVQGIASLTDVVTSIVGDLPVAGGEEPAIVKRDDGSWLLDGAIDLDTLVRTLDDRSLITEENGQHYHTLGGLVMASLGRIPRIGDVFERGRYRFEVVDMDGNRVDRVLAAPLATGRREEEHRR
jgi:putative hemolysin